MPAWQIALIVAALVAAAFVVAIALRLWTVTHGVSAMLISRPYLPWGDAEEFTDRVLRAVVVGEIVSGAVDPKVNPQEAITMLRGILDEQHR